MRKSAFGICQNKGDDHLCANSAADQPLISAFVFASQIVQYDFLKRNFKHLAIFCGCTAQSVSDLVGNLKDKFSCDTAHKKYKKLHFLHIFFSFLQSGKTSYLKSCFSV